MNVKCKTCGITHSEKTFEVCLSQSLFKYVTVWAVSESDARVKALNANEKPTCSGWRDYDNNMQAEVV